MKESEYKNIINELPFLISGIKYEITILSNTSALLNDNLKDINWVGFYLNKDNKLILGPFQGHVACLEIPFNKGVCGACATKKETIIVENVHEFKSHIACDSASNSEICVPIFVNDSFYGLLDIDSPSLARFDEVDKEYLEKIINIIENALTYAKND